MIGMILDEVTVSRSVRFALHLSAYDTSPSKLKHNVAQPFRLGVFWPRKTMQDGRVQWDKHRHQSEVLELLLVMTS